MILEIKAWEQSVLSMISDYKVNNEQMLMEKKKQ